MENASARSSIAQVLPDSAIAVWYPTASMPITMSRYNTDPAHARGNARLHGHGQAMDKDFVHGVE